MGFCVANTKKGIRIGWVIPSMVTHLSLFHHFKEGSLCFCRGPVYLINQNNIAEYRAGLEFKSPSLGLKTEVPTTSLGIRSGVNCRREKSASMIFAISFAVKVLATPGTPSIKICPSHNGTYQQQVNHFILPDDDLAYLVFNFIQGFVEAAQVGALLKKIFLPSGFVLSQTGRFACLLNILSFIFIKVLYLFV